MLKYTVRCHEFTAQAAHLTAEAASPDDPHEVTVDDEQNPAHVIVYTATGDIAALRIAQRHLTHLHARLAYANPGTVDRTAADIVYAEARTRAETLTAAQRKEESLYAIHSEDDELRMDALFDVMRERREIDL
ncbi:hypothetical protein ACIHJG_35815 [Streptomyces sp. NPDC052415]|uniref:hypothetical protein n=1 Tax=Streptomyces sp. NPDC052415 TaxID=3365690 RepID=UPI0037D68779